MMAERKKPWLPERKIQASILQYLNKRGIFNFKVISASKRGIPDIFLIYHRKPLFLEVKQPLGRTSEVQKYQIDEIIKHGGNAFVVTSVQEVENILNNEDFIYSKENGTCGPGEFEEYFKNVRMQNERHFGNSENTSTL